MSNKYDIIIIGSGLGGLVCGYILSKNGLKVAIIEKNNQLGGCLQSFKRFGVKFDTGMHYIGSMEEGQILYRFFQYLNLIKDVKISRLDPNGYDIISLAGSTYRFASGYDNFFETLSSQFPHNKEDIKKYIRSIRDIADASPLYNLRKINTHTFIEADYIKTSINEFIASITSNYRLQNVLASNLPLYAGIRDKTPTYIHALITNFYMQSAFRIIGGSDSISNSLSNSITSFGGTIFRNSTVEKIICNATKATAVQLSNGEIIEADSFISNVHPQSTLNMLDTQLIRKAYRDRINDLQNSISNFTIYLKFKEGMLPYLNSNYYYYEKDNVWNANNYSKATAFENYLFMHQCYEDNAKYAQSAEMIAYMNWDEVKPWANTKVGMRGESYEEFKEEHAQRLLAKLEQSFPGIGKTIENYETSTPLTYRDYTNTFHGSMYGIARDKNFPTQTLVSQRTKIPNLFLTGQNINSHGILGVSIGAAITCAEFLGLNNIINEIE